MSSSRPSGRGQVRRGGCEGVWGGARCWQEPAAARGVLLGGAWYLEKGFQGVGWVLGGFKGRDARSRQCLGCGDVPDAPRAAQEELTPWWSPCLCLANPSRLLCVGNGSWQDLTWHQADPTCQGLTRHRSELAHQGPATGSHWTFGNSPEPKS